MPTLLNPYIQTCSMLLQSDSKLIRKRVKVTLKFNKAINLLVVTALLTAVS
jgi:hypothetical protein